MVELESPVEPGSSLETCERDPPVAPPVDYYGGLPSPIPTTLLGWGCFRGSPRGSVRVEDEVQRTRLRLGVTRVDLHGERCRTGDSACTYGRKSSLGFRYMRRLRVRWQAKNQYRRAGASYALSGHPFLTTGLPVPCRSGPRPSIHESCVGRVSSRR